MKTLSLIVIALLGGCIKEIEEPKSDKSIRVINERAEISREKDVDTDDKDPTCCGY